MGVASISDHLKAQQLLVWKAQQYAAEAHRGQVRKYTGEPYVLHCIEVAMLAADYGLASIGQTTAMLHDTVEDTEITHEDIVSHFGHQIALGVRDLTDESWDLVPAAKPNRKTRKGIALLRLAAAPAWVQTIKVCDLISNTRTIAAFDPKFAKTYLPEAYALFGALTKANPEALDRGIRQVVEAGDSLGIRLVP